MHANLGRTSGGKNQVITDQRPQHGEQQPVWLHFLPARRKIESHGIGALTWCCHKTLADLPQIEGTNLGHHRGCLATLPADFTVAKTVDGFYEERQVYRPW